MSEMVERVARALNRSKRNVAGYDRRSAKMSILTNDHWHRKCIEPVKRRHGSTTPQWQHHRFEIKGGISFRDAMIYDMMIQPNHFIVEGPDGELTFRNIPVRIVEAA